MDFCFLSYQLMSFRMFSSTGTTAAQITAQKMLVTAAIALHNKYKLSITIFAVRGSVLTRPGETKRGGARRANEKEMQVFGVSTADVITSNPAQNFISLRRAVHAATSSTCTAFSAK